MQLSFAFEPVVANRLTFTSPSLSFFPKEEEKETCLKAHVNQQFAAN